MTEPLLPRFLPGLFEALPPDIAPVDVAAWVERHKPALETALVRATSPGKRDRKSCQDVCDLFMVDSLLCGAKTSVHLPSQTETPRDIPARWCLVRASDVRPSNDPLNGFAPTPGYPLRTQERRYQADPKEQAKVRGIARHPQPGLIYNTGTGATDGTPIVTTTGIALGGNGRTMGTMLHYHDGGYIISDYIVMVAEDFGFDPREVDALVFAPGDGPMIVRVIDIPESEWPAAVRALNVPLTMAMDSVAEAVAFSKQISPEALDYLAHALGEDDMTLHEYLLSQRSVPFINALWRTGLINAQNSSRLIGEGGLLSADGGRPLVIGALAAALSPDPDLLDAAHVELRNALARSAPYWLAAAAYGRSWDLRAPLDKAIRDYLAFKGSSGYGSIAAWKRQIAIVQRHSDGDPLAERLLDILAANRGPVQLSKIARHFMSAATAYGSEQTSMFKPKTPLEVLHEKPGGPQVVLFGEGLPRHRRGRRRRGEVAEAMHRSDAEILAGRGSYGPELDAEIYANPELEHHTLSNWARQDRVAALARVPRELVGPLYEGGQQLISREPGSPSQWRATRFDEQMEPTGHFGPASFAQVVNNASFDGEIADLRPITFAEALPRRAAAKGHRTARAADVLVASGYTRPEARRLAEALAPRRGR